MQDTQTATILAFPMRSVPRTSLSVGHELERLGQNLMALAAALRGCTVAFEGLALVLQENIVDTSCDC
jgi:hypothetical protein